MQLSNNDNYLSRSEQRIPLESNNDNHLSRSEQRIPLVKADTTSTWKESNNDNHLSRTEQLIPLVKADTASTWKESNNNKFKEYDHRTHIYIPSHVCILALMNPLHVKNYFMILKQGK